MTHAFIALWPIFFQFCSQVYILIKAGFHMIADDRGSQIADDRKDSCFHIINYAMKLIIRLQSAWEIAHKCCKGHDFSS